MDYSIAYRCQKCRWWLPWWPYPGYVNCDWLDTTLYDSTLRQVQGLSKVWLLLSQTVIVCVEGFASSEQNIVAVLWEKIRNKVLTNWQNTFIDLHLEQSTVAKHVRSMIISSQFISLLVLHGYISCLNIWPRRKTSVSACLTTYCHDSACLGQLIND